MLGRVALAAPAPCMQHGPVAPVCIEYTAVHLQITLYSCTLRSVARRVAVGLSLIMTLQPHHVACSHIVLSLSQLSRDGIGIAIGRRRDESQTSLQLTCR